MKYLKLLPIMAFVMLASCKLDPSDGCSDRRERNPHDGSNR